MSQQGQDILDRAYDTFSREGLTNIVTDTMGGSVSGYSRTGNRVKEM